MTPSTQAKDLLRQLLCRKDKRLGSGAGGVADIKSHPFFKGIPWDNIREQDPPHVPDIASAADTSNFPDVEVGAAWPGAWRRGRRGAPSFLRR